MENVDLEKDIDKENTVEDQDIQDAESTEESTETASNVDYLDKYQRCLAEFDNFRKRTAKEKAGMYDNGVKDTIEKVLPVIDNFERALQTCQNKDDSFYKGIEMILKQFEGIFDELGIEEIETVGKTFDPNLHNAVAHVDDDNFGDNEIMEQLQKGYMYKDKVIRFSMVKVAN